MPAIKTAYELALQRIIVARYKPQEEAKEEELPEESFVPEFVTDFKFPDKDSFVPVNMSGEDKEGAPVILEEPEIDEPGEIPLDIKLKDAESIAYSDKTMEVHWYGDFLSYTGFSRMNRAMVFGLSNRMMRVKIEMTAANGSIINQATQDQLHFLENNVISPKAPKVYGATVPLSFMHEGKKILYTMIETSGKVHNDYAGKLGLFDEIWVPTQYGRNILLNSKIRTPIHVMPLGVDVSRYKPDTNPFNFGMKLNKFVFLSVFRWSYRKGFDLLLRSYLEEFSGKEDVSLLIVSRALEFPEEQSAKKIAEDFAAIRNTIDKSDEELPHIALYVKPISEAKMPMIYNSADAFVLLSRGEGFGLPYCEAGACGLPIIATSCSGHSDFIKEDTAFVVEPEGYATASTTGNLARMAKLCHFYEGQEFPVFGRTSINKIKEHMRCVYEQPEAGKKKSIKLKRIIQANYTWDMAVDRVHARLNDLSK